MRPSREKHYTAALKGHRRLGRECTYVLGTVFSYKHGLQNIVWMVLAIGGAPPPPHPMALRTVLYMFLGVSPSITQSLCFL